MNSEFFCSCEFWIRASGSRGGRRGRVRVPLRGRDARHVRQLPRAAVPGVQLRVWAVGWPGLRRPQPRWLRRGGLPRIFKRRNLTLLFRPKRAHVRPRCRRISVVRSPVWFNRVVCRRGQRFGSRFQNLPGPPRLLPPCSRPLPPSFSSQAAECDAAKKEEEMRQARRKAADQRRRRLWFSPTAPLTRSPSPPSHAHCLPIVAMLQVHHLRQFADAAHQSSSWGCSQLPSTQRIAGSHAWWNALRLVLPGDIAAREPGWRQLGVLLNACCC